MVEYVADEVIHVIQCYILDSDGEDAFSFLLNSHQKIFNDARLETEVVKSRDKLIGKGADAIVTALQFQLDALSTAL